MSKTCGCLVGQRCNSCDPVAAEVARAVGDVPFRASKDMYDASQRGADPTLTDEEVKRFADTLQKANPDVSFLLGVLAEVRKARAKFPDNGSLVTGLALGEESGEAQRALLHIYEGKSAEEPLYLECVQTAAMALRLALEGDDRAEWKGNVAKRIRDELADPVRFPRRAD